MPEQGVRIFATHVATLSKVVDAPLPYVYDWCTDFRSDDGKLSRSKSRHRVIHISPRRLVRVRVAHRGDPDPAMQIELVRLRPPNAWHKDSVGEEDLDSVDYRLAALGPRRTRIQVRIVERWMVPKFPRKVDWVRSSSAYWDALVRTLEERYRSGKPAQG